ncbi:MAG: pantothenate kinase [Geminicoccus sp.]|nr:pantothenate kinase [Geminicoccus sp.]
MILAIDSGNTNVLFTLLRDGEAVASWRRAVDDRRTADEDGVWLLQLMNLKGTKPADITGVIISSVRPAALFGLRQLAEVYFACAPLVVGDDGLPLNFEVRVDRPEQVGADRLVNTRAVTSVLGQGPAIVVDFGTATTLDVVAADGAYIGGVIAPGVNLSAEALYQAAARLPRIDIQKPNSVLGQDTVACMQSGLFWGYVSMIEGLIARLREELDLPSAPVVATGGLAVLFAGGTDVFDHLDPDFTVKGLAALYSDWAKTQA